MTLKEHQLMPAMACVKDSGPLPGARCAGIHLEGPFLCYNKRGAQNPDNLHAPDADMFMRLNEASGGAVRLITVAPEVEGGIDFIKRVSPVCTVSVGHTEADYDTAMRAYEAGASHTTHLFNGMPGLHHRKPGVIGAAFDAARRSSSSATACICTRRLCAWRCSFSAATRRSSRILCDAPVCRTGTTSSAACP